MSLDAGELVACAPEFDQVVETVICSEDSTRDPLELPVDGLMEEQSTADDSADQQPEPSSDGNMADVAVGDANGSADSLTGSAPNGYREFSLPPFFP